MTVWIADHGDLVIGVAIQAVLTAACFWCGRSLARRCSATSAFLIALGTLAVTLAFAVTLLGRLTLSRLIPWSNAILLANLVPWGGGFMSGLVAGQTTIPLWRRAGVTVMLLTLSWYTLVRDLVSENPSPGRPNFLDGMCMQTTPASCSPCSAVAVLMEYGIRATEREMMQLCLTRYGGTPELGLYRGIKLKTAGTPWEVRILQTDLEGLLRVGRLPAVLLVNAVDGSVSAGPWWQASRPDHAVVLFRWTDNGRAEIGDPSSGRSVWPLERLQRRWKGTGLYLAPREATPDVAQ
jgi:hypothetical protein